MNDEFQDIMDQISGPSVDEYVTFDDDVARERMEYKQLGLLFSAKIT